MLADRYPPPGVWRQVDEASHNADELWSEGREIAFEKDDAGALTVSLIENGKRVRELSLLETLAVAAGAPL